MDTPKAALQRAIEIKGSQKALAAAIGTQQANVSYWLLARGMAPAEYVLPIERETGVPRTELRPDLYPVEST